MARAALAVEQEQETTGDIVAIIRSRKTNTNEQLTSSPFCAGPQTLKRYHEHPGEVFPALSNLSRCNLMDRYTKGLVSQLTSAP